jgi:hypothetical protein
LQRRAILNHQNFIKPKLLPVNIEFREGDWNYS